MFSISEYLSIEKKGGFYFFLAEDRYILKSIKESIVKEIAEKGGIELLIFDLDENENALKDGISHAKEIGFFSTKKVIVIENASVLFKKEFEKKRVLFEEYIKNPEENNLIIFLADSVDKKTKLYKELSKSKDFFTEIPFPEKSELEKFIKNQFLPVVPDAGIIAFFHQKTNADLFYIATEIEKLKLYALSKNLKTLSKKDADEILTEFNEEKVFAIVEMCVKGEAVKAISLYRSLKISESEQKINPIIINLFIRHFKALLKGKVLAKEGRDSEFYHFLRENKLFYMDTSFFKTLIRAVKNKTIIDALGRISEIELGMKGSEEVKISDISSAIEQFMIYYF